MQRKYMFLWVLIFVVGLAAAAIFVAIRFSGRILNQGRAGRTIYYCAKNGSDSNPGSKASPFLTIQKAAEIAEAGNTVIVKAGTYKEMIDPSNNGSSGSPITFKSYPGDKVVIDGKGKNPAVDLSSSRYTVFDGFEVAYGISNISLKNASHVEVKNCILRDASQSSALNGRGAAFCKVRLNRVLRAANCGILLEGGAHDNLVEYNTVSDTVSNDGLVQGSAEYPAGKNNVWQYNTSTGNTEDGLDFYSGDYTTVKGNTLFDNGEKGIYLHGASRCRIDDNLVYGNGWYGLYLGTQYGPGQDNIFLNNLFHANGRLVENDADLVINAPKNSFINNTFVARTGATRALFQIYNGAPGTVFYNNIFINDSRSVFSFFESTAISITSDYNLFYTPSSSLASKAGVNYPNLAAWQAATGYDSHSVFADPLFNDRQKNFRLRAGSPAINAGTHAGAPATDILGKPRGNAPDIGAYEY